MTYRPGAGDAIATSAFVNAKPDGHTPLLNSSALATEQAFLAGDLNLLVVPISSVKEMAS